jgi:PucR C-terminal helix-turn-helix domain
MTRPGAAPTAPHPITITRYCRAIRASRATRPQPPSAMPHQAPVPPVVLQDHQLLAGHQDPAAPVGARAHVRLAPLRRGEVLLVDPGEQRDRVADVALPGPPLATGTCAGPAALAGVAAGLENARYAAYVAARVPSFGRSADWAGLGACAAFQHVYRDPSAPERICPGVSALLDPRAGVYRETLRCFLDCAGQAQQAAGQLHIHRTTLYWRLARAAGLVSLDLHQGSDRLKLHLALALADLTHPPAGPAGPAS